MSAIESDGRPASYADVVAEYEQAVKDRDQGRVDLAETLDGLESVAREIALILNVTRLDSWREVRRLLTKHGRTG